MFVRNADTLKYMLVQQWYKGVSQVRIHICLYIVFVSSKSFEVFLVII